MLTSILLLTALVADSGPNSGFRMTCLDGRPLAEVYTTSFRDIQNYLYRVRELGIMAANGTLSVTDRGFLEDEKSAILEEMSRIIHQTQYIDIFGENHQIYEKGMNFVLAYPSQVSNRFLVSKFKFPKLSVERLGRLASRAFRIQGDKVYPPGGISRLQLNETVIETPDDTADTVSADYGWASSIAWARKINEEQYQTGIQAVVEDTIWNLKVDHSQFPRSLKNLRINRVSLAGQAQDLEQLIAEINDYSNSTGVKARVGAEKGLQLYTEDGRNISLDLNLDEKLAALFAGALSSGALYVQQGSIELQSAKDFKVSDPDHWLGSEEDYHVALAGEGLSAIDLRTAKSAADSLRNCDAGIGELNRLAIKIHQLAAACSE